MPDRSHIHQAGSGDGGSGCDDDNLGSVLAGRYRIDACLGKGGMGAVYSAADLLVNRHVAVKIVLPHYALDATSVMRLQKEARAIGRLDHANIVKLHDFNVSRDGPPFLVMDLLVGCTLADLIRGGGQLPVADVVEIFTQTGAGLEHAHAHGVLHRDLKPSNIMIVDRDKALQSVRILDFGTAKIAESADQDTNQLTKTGQIFGSPLYMSPEQANGKKLDVRSDIYSLGCSLFEALTGVPPFSGDTAIATIMKHQTDKPSSLREASLGKIFPARLERLVQNTLEKNPQDRYQTMSELLADLRKIDLAETDDPGRGPVSETIPHRHSLRLITGVALLALAIGTLIPLSWHFVNQALPPEKSAALPIPKQEGLSEMIPLDADQIAMRNLATAAPDDVKLRLHNANMSERSLKQLQGFANLQELNLGWAKFNDRGYGLSGIERLPIKFLILSASSATEINFEQASHIQSLEHLEANSSKITDKSLLFLVGCKNMDKLELNRCRLITDGALKNIALMKGLRTLILRGNTQLTDASLEPIGRMPKLENLDLIGCKFGDRACRYLADNQSIEDLYLSGTQVTDAGMVYLARMPRLRTLLLGNTSVSNKGVEILEKSRSLRRVSVPLSVHAGRFYLIPNETIDEKMH